MSEWRDAKTAPKDGTVIILRVGDVVVAGYWNLADGVYDRDTTHPWTFLQPTALGGYGGLNAYEADDISHWQPLPEPPK